MYQIYHLSHSVASNALLTRAMDTDGLFRKFKSPYEAGHGSQPPFAQVEPCSSSSSRQEQTFVPSSPISPSQPRKRTSQEAELMVLIPTQKRRKLDDECQIWTPTDDPTDRSEISSDDEPEDALECPGIPNELRKRCRLDHVRPSDLVYPKSQYAGWIPPLPVISEREAIERLQVISLHAPVYLKR